VLSTFFRDLFEVWMVLGDSRHKGHSVALTTPESHRRSGGFRK
jgi:hypothetical protein